ncbi:hypothetical protein NE237_001812 [Protea cynaroides]|uniref:Uncharacterized protein n=1 Tax=Protea cynaroides TaxID=273540 RepID=A0A9Q0KU26_9MAGN|nr:hypothetical protein NE237_001812 [Protea cynaroides]
MVVGYGRGAGLGVDQEAGISNDWSEGQGQLTVFFTAEGSVAPCMRLKETLATAVSRWLAGKSAGDVGLALAGSLVQAMESLHLQLCKSELRFSDATKEDGQPWLRLDPYREDLPCWSAGSGWNQNATTDLEEIFERSRSVGVVFCRHNGDDGHSRCEARLPSMIVPAAISPVGGSTESRGDGAGDYVGEEDDEPQYPWIISLSSKVKPRLMEVDKEAQGRKQNDQLCEGEMVMPGSLYAACTALSNQRLAVQIRAVYDRLGALVAMCLSFSVEVELGSPFSYDFVGLDVQLRGFNNPGGGFSVNLRCWSLVTFSNSGSISTRVHGRVVVVSHNELALVECQLQEDSTPFTVVYRGWKHNGPRAKTPRISYRLGHTPTSQQMDYFHTVGTSGSTISKCTTLA